MFSRIDHAILETLLLNFSTDIKKIFQKYDTFSDKVSLKTRRVGQKVLIFFVGTETHDPFHSRTIVPTSVEKDDLASCRKMFKIPLDIDLGLLSVAWCRKRNDPKDSWAYTLGNTFDDAAFSCGVAPFEHYNNSRLGSLHPTLEVTKLHL
ncbi:hypothetical protein AVO44_18685 [Ruegeria profundi]|uniref:Uncharacterized protein n=1 Tax=Ruegeria profundi TaxID=1685378 RepID=A0A0X3TMS9_9RHOB|nr:hypothetical protein AVO44_18685 [Ruegeria profundi]